MPLPVRGRRKPRLAATAAGCWGMGWRRNLKSNEIIAELLLFAGANRWQSQELSPFLESILVEMLMPSSRSSSSTSRRSPMKCPPLINFSPLPPLLHTACRYHPVQRVQVASNFNPSIPLQCERRKEIQRLIGEFAIGEST